jgi:sialate O-acetylesterase
MICIKFATTLKAAFFAAFLFFSAAFSANAKIRLPGVFSDNMVLQQNSDVKIWGTASPNSTIGIKASWSRSAVNVKCGPNGKWSARIKTPAAGMKPQKIEIAEYVATEGKSKGRKPERVALNDVLIGEVWLCSGQSNMEITLNGYINCPIEGANDLIADAGDLAGVRYITIARNSPRHPADTCGGKWQKSSPNTAPYVSAVAFVFAKSLYEALGVPVGIIINAWGGSTVEGWLPESILKTYPDVDLKQLDDPKNDSWLRPEVMYNGMLHPIEGFSIRGALWYQGESNVGHADTYSDRLPTMISTWRKEWGIGDFPFIIVEIAPFDYSDGGKGIDGALLREAQYKVSQNVWNCYYVCTNDLVDSYEEDNIHPKNKTDVGRRMCYHALSDIYGMDGVSAYSPSFQSMEVRGDKAYLSFYNIMEGFVYTEGLKGFEIAGADKVFHPAEAHVEQDTLIAVSSPEVSEPVSVRYCFRDFQVGNVKNSRWLPLVPFRTDEW